MLLKHMPEYVLLHSIIEMIFKHTFLFFFNDTATTEIYTLSLHDALPISVAADRDHPERSVAEEAPRGVEIDLTRGRRLVLRVEYAPGSHARAASMRRTASRESSRSAGSPPRATARRRGRASTSPSIPSDSTACAATGSAAVETASSRAPTASGSSRRPTAAPESKRSWRSHPKRSTPAACSSPAAKVCLTPASGSRRKDRSGARPSAEDALSLARSAWARTRGSSSARSAAAQSIQTPLSFKLAAAASL